VILLSSAGALVVLMVASWLLSVLLADVSIVDVVWGVGFVAVAWIAYAQGDGDDARRLLLAVLVTIWGVRLAGYIGWRKLRHPGEDPRYTAMRERRGPRFVWLSLFTIFLLQGALVWVISLPVQVAADQGDALNALDAAGVALWAIGVAFESIGDGQLLRFKSDPANKGRVMDRGLWRYTRHPNYFGDFCVWWGLYLVALATGAAWWTAIGPLVVSVLLIRVSGKGMTEKVMAQRPGYAEYVARTSGFVPLPPR
jgi:steroid 5-alpha reductase family enzyme